jgi:hypothetical protein
MQDIRSFALHLGPTSFSYNQGIRRAVLTKDHFHMFADDNEIKEEEEELGFTWPRISAFRSLIPTYLF